MILGASPVSESIFHQRAVSPVQASDTCPFGYMSEIERSALLRVTIFDCWDTGCREYGEKEKGKTFQSPNCQKRETGLAGPTGNSAKEASAMFLKAK